MMTMDTQRYQITEGHKCLVVMSVCVPFMNSFQYLIMVEFYSKEEANLLIRSVPYFTASRNRNFRVSFTSFSRSKERNLATKLKYRLPFLGVFRRFSSIFVSAMNDKQNLSYKVAKKPSISLR